MTQKDVMGKVLGDPFVIALVPDFGTFSKDNLVERELMTSLIHFLSKVKRSYISFQLATKHAL
jgi:hypothetical protein